MGNGTRLRGIAVRRPETGDGAQALRPRDAAGTGRGAPQEDLGIDLDDQSFDRGKLGGSPGDLCLRLRANGLVNGFGALGWLVTGRRGRLCRRL